MSTTTGPVNEGSAASNARAVIDALGGVGGPIDLHPAWEFVKRVAGVTMTTGYTDVYKHLGSLNGYQDYYVGLHSTGSTTPSVGVIMFEQFDDTANTTTKWMPGPAVSGGYNNAADDSHGGPAVHVCDGVLTASSTSAPWALALSGWNGAGADAWWLHITNERFVLGKGGTPALNGAVHAGVIDRQPASNRWRLPVCASAIALNNGHGSGSSPRGFYGGGGSGSTSGGIVSRSPQAEFGLASPFIDSNVNGFVFCKIPVFHSGRFCGYMKDLIWINYDAGTPGDTATIGGEQYRFVGGKTWHRNAAV